MYLSLPLISHNPVCSIPWIKPSLNRYASSEACPKSVSWGAFVQKCCLQIHCLIKQQVSCLGFRMQPLSWHGKHWANWLKYTARNKAQVTNIRHKWQRLKTNQNPEIISQIWQVLKMSKWNGQCFSILYGFHSIFNLAISQSTIPTGFENITILPIPRRAPRPA